VDKHLYIKQGHLEETWNDGATINLFDEMMRLTLWIISKVLFGADVSGEERELLISAKTSKLW
jgi:cytochrome P450